ncbi:hypothetical protein ZWY2020_011213 [Hordeum vulgare]|nr:hypothetical protein ZWY2020_011213 [Hordeum vulgare]
MFVPKTDNKSDLEGHIEMLEPWLCSIALSKMIGVVYPVRYVAFFGLSLYFSSINEAEAKHETSTLGIICTGKISFHTIWSKIKAVVFSDGLQGNGNATGHMQASLGTLHKTYMARNQRRNIDITGKKLMADDDLVAEKDTSTDPSSSVKLDELGGNSSTVAANTQNKTLILDNELQHLSLERKPKNSKYKPEPWMLQGEDQEMPRQLNLAIVGHVDSGKSTLCGRLLHALGELQKSAGVALAFTMNVGVAYFDQKLPSCYARLPGHRFPDLAVLVVDASLGSLSQVWALMGLVRQRHSQLIRSFGVENLIVAVNKMDSVEYSGNFKSAITWVPLSAMENENLVTAASDTLILHCLLKLLSDLRKFLLQVLVMPCGELATVKIIGGTPLASSSAKAGDNVAIGLQGIDPIHVMSGGVLCHPDYPVCFELRAPREGVASLVRIVSLLEQKAARPRRKRGCSPRGRPPSSRYVCCVACEAGGRCAWRSSEHSRPSAAFLRSHGSTVAVGVVTRVVQAQEERAGQAWRRSVP